MAALAATLLPVVVGLALLGLQPWLVRRGEMRAAITGAKLALTSVGVAIALLAPLVQLRVFETRLAWIHVGRTTTLDWQVLLGPLPLVLSASALLVAVLAVLAGLSAGYSGGARPYARIALATGGALVLATGGALWQAGLGVAAVVLACRAWPHGHEPKDMVGSPWAPRLVGIGLVLAGIAWQVSAGDLEFLTIERAALLQERSTLVRGQIGGPFGALAPGLVAALSLGTATLAWVLGWPRLLARAFAEGPAGAAVIAGAGAPVVAVIALQTQVALALAPTTLALWTLAAAGLASFAGVRAARAAGTGACVAAVGQVMLAIAAAAIGIGAPTPALRLLVVGGLASAAVIAALPTGRRGRVAVVAMAAIGLAPALAGAVVGLWTHLSAWSPGVNVVAPALALVAVGGLAAGLSRVLSDRTEGPGWRRPEAPGLLLAAAGLLALAAALAGLWPADRLQGRFVVGRLLVGEYALGPRPEVIDPGTIGGVVLIAAAAGIGLWLAPRVRVRESGVRGRRATTIWRIVGTGERLLGRLTLRPGDERSVVAPGRPGDRSSLLLAAAGTLAIVGSVFCNPDVMVIGPSQMHPIDLGGLDPAMVGARRPGPERPPSPTDPVPSRRRGAEPDGVGPQPFAVPEEVEPRDMSEGSGESGARPGTGDGFQGMSEQTWRNAPVGGDMSGQPGGEAPGGGDVSGQPGREAPGGGEP